MSLVITKKKQGHHQRQIAPEVALPLSECSTESAQRLALQLQLELDTLLPGIEKPSSHLKTPQRHDVKPEPGVPVP